MVCVCLCDLTEAHKCIHVGVVNYCYRPTVARSASASLLYIIDLLIGQTGNLGLHNFALTYFITQKFKDHF